MTRRRRLPTDGHVPEDASLLLKPGEHLLIRADQPPPEPTQLQIIYAARNLRGDVLAHSFGIENELIMLCLADKFGAFTVGEEPRERLEQEDAWRGEHSFSKAYDRAKPLIRARLGRSSADRLIQRIAGIRDLRNTFAHYPFWLEPVNDSETGRTVSFLAYIANSKFVYLIDEPQKLEWQRELLGVRDDLEALRAKIDGHEISGGLAHAIEKSRSA